MRKIALSRVDRELLLLVFRTKDGTTVGDIISKIGISISVAAASFRTLRKAGFVHQRGSLILLSSRGHSWLIQNQAVFGFSGAKKWREVPEEFTADRIKPFEPYAPRLSKLDQTHFKLGGRNRG